MKKQKNYAPILVEEDNPSFIVERDAKKIHEIFTTGICNQDFTDEDLDEMENKFGLMNICTKIADIIFKKYSVDLSDVSFITDLSKLSLEASAKYIDDKLKVVDIDVLLKDELHTHFVLLFLFEHIVYEQSISSTGVYENNIPFISLFDKYFRYIFTKFYALIEDGCKCQIYTLEQVRYEYNKIGRSNSFNVAICCDYCATYFLIAHECAHIYFERCGKNFEDSEQYSKEEIEEFEADKFAFDIIKDIISFDEKNDQCIEEERVLYPYTYKAPLILLSFYHMYFTIYDKLIADSNALTLRRDVENRVKKLQEYIQDSTFDFDVEIGNRVYSSIEDTIAIFYEMLEDYQADGRISKLIEIIKNG